MCPTTIPISLMPKSVRLLSAFINKGDPLTSTIDLGMVFVIGRSLLPKPAARIKAFNVNLPFDILYTLFEVKCIMDHKLFHILPRLYTYLVISEAQYSLKHNIYVD